MKQNISQKTKENVRFFLSSVAEEQKHEDSYTMLNLMGKLPKQSPFVGHQYYLFWRTSLQI